MLSEHFSEEEFACHCCGEQTTISPRLIELLERLRADCGGLPIQVSSGYRCEENNRRCGGVPNSTHMRGVAADLLVPEHLSSIGEFKWYIENIGEFDGVGVYDRGYNGKDGWIHVDVRDGGVGAGYYWEG